MAKVSVTANQMLQGDYGTAKKGDTVELEEVAAKRLAKAGVVTLAGVENEGKLDSKGKQITAKDAPPHRDSDKRINVETEKSAPAKTKKK